MRTLSFIVVVMLFMGTVSVSAQQERKQNTGGPQMENKDHMRLPMNDQEGMMIPNLTEEQKTKIKDLRIALHKTVQPLKNQLGELEARQHSLATAEKPDMKVINANIDDITKVQNQMMKAMAAHRQDVRSLLTEEQKIQFDSQRGEKKMHKKMQRPLADAHPSPEGCPASMPE